MFKISARTILELGAELISSDVIAFYELIKNAIDAKSPTGAEIRFEIILRRRDCERFRRILSEIDVDIDRVRSDIERSINRSAPRASTGRVIEMIERAPDAASLSAIMEHVHRNENHIIVSDNGSGMSKQTLIDSYLVIGTANRKKVIDAALVRGAIDDPPPYLGEKGIGRLSAMRLGDHLTVETAEKADRQLNRLDIDWTSFNDLDAMIEDIDITPRDGGPKPRLEWSGTRLTIRALNTDWTYEQVSQLGKGEFARLTDPFRDPRQRPRIAVFWNGQRIPIATMDRSLLSNAHASIKGSFTFDDGKPALECVFRALDLGFEHPPEVDRRYYRAGDLQAAIAGTSEHVAATAIDSLGPLEFEAYWFNRRRLGGIDSIGDSAAVRSLQQQWAGIMLFRDGFRVMPYGEETDDWLELDRRALGSTGYLLNKAQFVGHVQISRIANGALVDQTNREGLRACPEQRTLVILLQFLMYHLRVFLREIRSRHQNQPVDIRNSGTEVSSLMKRAERAVRGIGQEMSARSPIAGELNNTFNEIKEHFDRLRRRARELERENREMIQMAGVGLMVEVVAHELARSSESALSAIEDLRRTHIPGRIRGLIETLAAEMKAISKRIRVLDPMSVSGRQRRERFDLGELLDNTLSGHQRQFIRHGVALTVTKTDEPIPMRAVKGMVVQILENLISNSIYWLGFRGARDPTFKPHIAIGIVVSPLTIVYEDNGPGIASDHRDKVFLPFFSLKEPSKRRGLGLFIARECAKFHGGQLQLDDRSADDEDRLHRFVLEFPDEVSVK